MDEAIVVAAVAVVVEVDKLDAVEDATEADVKSKADFEESLGKVNPPKPVDSLGAVDPPPNIVFASAEGSVENDVDPNKLPSPNDGLKALSAVFGLQMFKDPKSESLGSDIEALEVLTTVTEDPLLDSGVETEGVGDRFGVAGKPKVPRFKELNVNPEASLGSDGSNFSCSEEEKTAPTSDFSGLTVAVGAAVAVVVGFAMPPNSDGLEAVVVVVVNDVSGAGAGAGALLNVFPNENENGAALVVLVGAAAAAAAPNEKPEEEEMFAVATLEPKTRGCVEFATEAGVASDLVPTGTKDSGNLFSLSTCSVFFEGGAGGGTDANDDEKLGIVKGLFSVAGFDESNERAGF